MFDFVSALDFGAQFFLGYIGFVAVVTIAGICMLIHYAKKEAR